MTRTWLCIALMVFAPTELVADWSVFSPVAEVRPPSSDNEEWSGAIDAFIYARLQEAGLSPPPAVGRRQWIRRATYDLWGLPPSPEDVRALLNDTRPDMVAMADVVDRLLASPRYGERWARHWLDVVRYADTDGFAIDEERLWLWRYRDYVIRVFNEDRPFDQFIREQIAGDELDLGALGQVAVSFYRLGPWEADNMTAEHRRQDYLNDITSTVGSAFLGLTVGCARCHDHRFDPILQEDFYRLQAFFTPLQQATLATEYLPGENSPIAQRRRQQAVDRRLAKIEQLRQQLKKKIAQKLDATAAEISDSDLDKAIEDKQDPITKEDISQLNQLRTDKKHLAAEQRFESKVAAIRNPKPDETCQPTFRLNNGDPFDPGEELTPGFLSEVPVWSTELVSQAADSNTAPAGRRRILATWLTDPHNPITPRVLVNRIWHYHFGAGIVATPNDFGENGSGPSHPQLMDYLARQLLEDGWRLKPLHRRLLLSRTYRSSAFHPQHEDCTEVDPDNRLLWRSPLRRLESEAIRDAVLAICGRLALESGGPGFFEILPRGMGSSYPFFTWEPSVEDQRRRRSIYMFQRRNLVHPMMETFDVADLNLSCERRGTSVTAPQALALFNSEFAYENSLYLATRLQHRCDHDTERVARLFWLAVARAPSAQEQESCLAFLQAKRQAYTRQPTEADDGQTAQPDIAALRDLILALINTNEFLYLD